MPEETPVVDCHLSKDLEFARNLARQMRDGYGRHNSTRAFRQPGGPSVLDFLHRENQQARVIGRLGDNAIRERWQDCAIGDAVPERLMEHGMELHIIAGVNFIDKIFPKPIRVFQSSEEMPPSVSEQNCERRSFERVCFPMRSVGGDCGWRDEYLWKRIS